MIFTTKIQAIKIQAIDSSGELSVFRGPNIEAFTWELAEAYCENNGLGYCQVTGILVCEIEDYNKIYLNQ